MTYKSNQDWPHSFERPHSWDRRDEQWYIRYLELTKYKEEYGDCEVPNEWKKNKSLGLWVNKQRERKDQMASWRVELLNTLGFTWRIKSRIPWEDHYELLVDFKKNNGHLRVPSQDKNYSRLSKWTIVQRKRYRQGVLTPKRISLLELIGFDWQPTAKHLPWEEHYQALLAFKSQYGHCHVLKSEPGSRRLGEWVIDQRKFYKKGLLSEAKIKKLEAIGFCWDYKAFLMQQNWDKHYNLLVNYHRKYGTCLVSYEEKSYEHLARWVNKQRNCKEKLNDSQLARLNVLNFEWKGLQHKGLLNKDSLRAYHHIGWLNRFEELKNFKAKHGHFDIPNQPGYKKLHAWVIAQKKSFKQGTIPPDRLALLQGACFDLSTFYEKQWFRRYEQLKRFKSEQGHCNVSRRGENASLGNWVKRQKLLFRQEKLSARQIHLLDELGFEWIKPSLEEVWLRRFEELKDFKRQRGHYNVPQWGDTISLGRWVAKQRGHFKQGKLSQERIDLLNSIDFEWSYKGKNKKN